MEDDAPKKEGSGKAKAINYDELDENIQTHKTQALKHNKLSDAMESLLNIEKQMRLAADITGTKKVVAGILETCFEAGDWKGLNEQIVLLSKRRAQLKQAVVEMVQRAMAYIDKAPDVETQIELIKTLNTVTAGKIYVEIQRALLTKRLAKIKELQGKIDEAAEIMQEVAVETFGAMARTEKLAFILEQVRLCLDRKDFVRAQILAKKINPRVFTTDPAKEKKEKPMDPEQVMEAAPADVPPLLDLKVIYYELMIRYYRHGREYLEICRAYQNIYDTPSIRDDPLKWQPVMKKIVWYLCLAPHDPMQRSLMQATHDDKKLLELPKYKALLKQFITLEVVRWKSLSELYRPAMESEPDIFGGEWGKKSLEDLKQRIVEHNILVISKYYARVTLKRLSELLDLPTEETEKYLADMVTTKALVAKVDRPAGIINFQARQDSHEVLNTWAVSIEKLLELVEKSCHQIHKEAMLHKVALPVS
eukprot:TRINITY_DN16644_c0_g1_i1.p1 TRINITY_DN16644_c0_g1~~TRINITY_DN16644_c0_g1_i1.p1  ORF type:complete len:477 (+),score=150.55 TRINITY_DN16644_c0_g1_i1:140-1570(+)